MNIYKVRFMSDDHRLWEVRVRADGISEREDVIVFWKGWFHRNVHFIAKEAFVSAICEKEWIDRS